MKIFVLAALAAFNTCAADTFTAWGRAWTVPAAEDWKLEEGALGLVSSRGPLPGPRRPIQFALTDVSNYRRLTVEADMMPLGRSLAIAFAYRDPAHFDYAHLSIDTAEAQPVHNGIFHVYGGERVRISTERGPAAFAASGRWYHVTLVHDAATGTVDVTVDGRAEPALHAVDLSLGPGKVGLGSFDETGAFKNVKITAAGAQQTDWPSYGNDPGAMRYSGLRQIDTNNVARLELAWTFRTGKPGSEAVPIVVGGAMYVTAPDGVYALVPETGELLWKYDAAPVALRGLAYWVGAGGLHPRVFTGNGIYLLALDATTGKPAPGFGNEGRVDLRKGVLGELKDGQYALQSPPAVFEDIVITGCSNGEGSPSAGAYGDIRAWDAKTGKLLWTFHTVPRPGEPGSETWAAGSWKNRSGTNVWGFFTVDAQRGIVYAPLGAPTSDFYGADRLGDGLYGNSLVALDARTGTQKWHQQLVHHDLWDYDLAAPPALFDIRRGGRVTPAVAEITKMGLLFVFDRVTGEPVYGMEERPVPQTAIPGEVTARTQPFPVRPPPLARNTFRLEDMYDRSPEHSRFCRELFEANRMKIGGPYTPLPLEGNALFFPSTLGGGNWGGVSVDPSLGLLFVNVMNVGQWGHMERRGTEYVRTSAYGPYARFWDREIRVPCQNPPFGELVAVDLASGDIAWRAVLGRIEALEAIGVRDTGTLNLGGSIATAGGLVFIGATNDSRFRAFDSRAGKLLWEEKLEASGHSSPITYLGRDGRQYVALMAAGGGGFLNGGLSNTLVAFALPDVERKPLPASVSEAVAAAAAATRGLPKVGAFQPAILPPGGAKALVEKTCGTGCHSAEVVTSQRMSAAEWNTVVRNMVARGAQASDAQVTLMVEYLAKTLGREKPPQ